MTLNPVSLSPVPVFTTGAAVARHGWGRLLSPLRVGAAVRHVGLDLQDRRAHAVVLEAGRQPVLTAFASVPLAARADGTPSLKPLARSLTTLGAAHAPMTCGLGPPHAQTALLPDMGDGRPDPQTLAQALEGLALNPAIGATVGVGCRVAAPSGESQTLFVAADTQRANHLARQLRTVGVGHARITAAALALDTLVRNDPASAEAERCLVVHLGPEETLLALIEESGPASLRTLAIASDEITSALTRPFTTPEGRVELTTRQAQVLRQRLDLSQTGETLLPTGQRVDITQILALIRPVVERLAVEVAKFARTTAPSGTRRLTAMPVFVTGEGAELQGLTNYLEHELHMDVRLLNPLASLTVSPSGKEAVRIGQRRHRLALAIGYALDPRVSIDLTPRGLRLRRAVSLFRWGVRLAVAAALTMIALQVVEGTRRATRLRGEIRDQQSIMANLVPLARQVAERDAWRARIAEQGERRRRLAADRHEPLTRLHQLLEQLPPELYADSIHLTQDETATITIEGFLIAPAGEDLRDRRRTLVDRLETMLGPGSRLAVEFGEGEVTGDLRRVPIFLECRDVPTGGPS